MSASVAPGVDLHDAALGVAAAYFGSNACTLEHPIACTYITNPSDDQDSAMHVVDET